MSRYRYRLRSDDTPFGAAFLDVVFCLVMSSYVALSLLMPFVNPPPKGEHHKKAELAPAALYVQVGWEFSRLHDVDTYLECAVHLPNRDPVISRVSFKQKSHLFLDLVRDDLGRPSPANHEQVMTNTNLMRLPPNTVCTLNVHLWSSHGDRMPLVGIFHVIHNKDYPEEELLTGEQGLEFSLKVKAEEITLMQLVIGEDGKVMKEATLFYPEAPFKCQARCDVKGGSQ